MPSFSNIPDDIFINILSRLPPKSIGYCRCVSKQWQFLLTRPEFIRTHLIQTIANPHQSLALPASRRRIGYVPLSDAHQMFDEMPLYLRTSHHPRLPWPLGSIDGSCHGLVLAAESVLNLVTGEIRELPDPPPYCSDPDEDSDRVWGFGYDSVHHDYKIVTVAYSSVSVDDDGNQLDPDETSEMFIDVFSLKNGTWRRLEGCSFDYFIDNSGKGVFVDGCINWLALSTADNKPHIVAFDLAAEKLSEVPPPACLVGTESTGHFSLAVLGGCLCFYHVTKKYFWVMKDYGVKESWTKFTINVPNLHQIEVFCLLSQEEVVMYRNAKKLMVYNVKEGTSKDIAVRGVFSRPPWTKISFMETLASPYVW